MIFLPVAPPPIACSLFLIPTRVSFRGGYDAVRSQSLLKQFRKYVQNRCTRICWKRELRRRTEVKQQECGRCDKVFKLLIAGEIGVNLNSSDNPSKSSL